MSGPFAVVQAFVQSCLAHAPERSADAAVRGWFAMRTHQGNVRSDNQDRVLMARWRDGGQTAWLLAVADGIGGGSEGAAAAAMALSAFTADIQEFSDSSLLARLERAAQRASQTVYERWRGKEGSTLSAVLVRGERRGWVNVGDSRIYGLDGQGNVTLLTQDDSLPLKGGLVQFMGLGKGLVPHVEEISATHQRVLMSTDGVHQYVEPLLPSLAGTAQHNDSALVDRMIHLALWCGGEDNATIAVAALDSSQEANLEACDVWTPGQHHRLVLERVEAKKATSSARNARKSTKPRSTEPKKGKIAAADRSKSEPGPGGNTPTPPPASDAAAHSEDSASRSGKRPDLLVTVEPATPGEDSPTQTQPDS